MKNLRYAGLSDEQLISEFLKGDNNCYGILYSRYYTKVYSKCYSFTLNSDDAFDMTQEILMKAICNVGSFGGNSKFSTWLYSIATNYCITQTGKKSRRYHEDIKAAHQILVMKYRQNYSVKDLQKEFALSASAVKMRLLRARTKMGQIMSLQDAV